MSARRWAQALARGSVPVGLGLLLWAAVGMGEERRQETLKVKNPTEQRRSSSPSGERGEARYRSPGPDPVERQALPEVQAELVTRRRHNELIMAALREAAETDENVARRPVPWRK